MAQQVKTLTSESLESAYRALTPSQDGFTEDLMASNTIVPVLNLTAAAEGTTPQILQTAIAFGSQTAFDVSNAVTTIANTPGFYRVFGTALNYLGGPASQRPAFEMTDGVSVKKVFGYQGGIGSGSETDFFLYDFVVFVASGISLNINSPSANSSFTGSIRQIADVNGNFINPSGFTPQ